MKADQVTLVPRPDRQKGAKGGEEGKEKERGEKGNGVRGQGNEEGRGGEK